MKLLITGGSGFIGEYVMQKLGEGQHIVMALSRSAGELQKVNHFENIHWVNSSLQLDTATLKLVRAFEPEVIVHLAWEKIPDFSFETSFENLQNHLFFFNSIFSIPSIKKVIVSGSCFEYNQKFGNCLESDDFFSTNYFTWAKNCLNDFLQFECRKKDISLLWVRIFYVYGPGQRAGSLIPSIINNLKAKKKPEIKSPANANDFIYVEDIAEGFRELVSKDVPAGIYNFGSGKSTQVVEVLRIVELLINKDESISREVLTRDNSSDQEINFWADMTKTRKYLEWEPGTSIEEGIQRTVKSL